MDQPLIVAKPPVKHLMTIRKKKIIAMSIIGGLILAMIILSILLELEAPPRKETLYSTGIKRALIIFHPSWKYRFQEDLTSAFARGLNTSGWAVDRITTSYKNPEEFKQYDMYIFGTNTYYWRPDLSTKRFLSEINLRQKPAIAIVSGPGYTERAEMIMKELLGGSNASSVSIHAFSLFRPGQDSLIPETNRQISINSAFQLGQEIGKKNLE